MNENLKPSVEPTLPLCPEHGKPPTLIYPCCGGAKGGRASTEWKGQTARENLQRANAAKAAKRKPR